MRESAVEKYLKAKVKAAGGETRKVKWIGHRGAPDRYVMLLWGCFWIELKAPGEIAEAHQLREHERMAKYQARPFVIDSYEAVDSFIKNTKSLDFLIEELGIVRMGDS